jgi:methionine synthase I (cobalamin-dependent)
MPRGAGPEPPDVIEGLHTSMLKAGAEVLETDTFQGSRIKLGEWGLADETLEINRRAASPSAPEAVGASTIRAPDPFSGPAYHV